MFSCNVLISLILTLVRKTFVVEFLSSLVLALSLSLNVSWQGRHLCRKDYLTQAIFKRVYSTADFIALVQKHARHLISSQLQLLVLTRRVQTGFYDVTLRITLCHVSHSDKSIKGQINEKFEFFPFSRFLF